MLRAALLALPLTVPALVAPAWARPDDGDERKSIQELLELARRERDVLLAELSATVDEIVTELDALVGRNTTRTARALRTRLEGLGPACAPLLVRYLDPGEDPDDGPKLRALKVAEILRGFGSPAVTEDLMRVASTASRRGRLNALVALAGAPDPARVVPFLNDLFQSSTGEIRQRTLATLAEIGGPEATALLARALADPDGDVVDVALRALGESYTEESSREVLTFLASDPAAKHVPAVIDYYAAAPHLVNEEAHLAALVELAKDFDVSRSDSLRILDALRRWNAEPSRDVRKAMEPLVDSSNSEVSEAALIVLARAKEKNARRRLVAKYDERVKERKDWPSVYEERATIFYKIGDYSKAIKDYKDAIELQRARTVDPGPYLGVARCYALLGRFKEASEYLDSAPVSMVTLRELARDPDFAAMLESKYARSFHLPD